MCCIVFKNPILVEWLNQQFCWLSLNFIAPLLRIPASPRVAEADSEPARNTYDRELFEFQSMEEAMFLASTTIPSVPGEIHPYLTLLNCTGE